jgi:hypothetical protein
MTGGVLKILVNYSRGPERIVGTSANIKDGYWRIPVVDVPPSVESESYTVVIEGYDTIKGYSEVLELSGASVSRNSVLFPLNGKLEIKNNENFPRKLIFLKDGDKDWKKEVEVPANGSKIQSFDTSGDYTVVDDLFQWNTVYVRVLSTSYLLPVKTGKNRIDIPDISPGSYTIRFYYGTKWVYQEDFVMVSNSSQNLGYKINDGQVSSVNSTSFSTTVDGRGY